MQLLMATENQTNYSQSALLKGISTVAFERGEGIITHSLFPPKPPPHPGYGTSYNTVIITITFSLIISTASPQTLATVNRTVNVVCVDATSGLSECVV